MIYWITGRACSGKTTKALELAKDGAVILDGDAVRQASGNQDYSDEGRLDNIMLIAHLARMIEVQGFDVICACVSPRKKWRQEVRKMFKESELIYMPGGTLWPGTEYEEPDEDERV